MNASVMTTMSKASIISKHYKIFKFLWMCLFIVFIIGGLCNIGQLMVLSFQNGLPFDTFSLLTIILIVSLFLSGIYGMYCNFKIEKRNFRLLQTLCIISACITLPFLFIIYIGVISEIKSLFLASKAVLYYISYTLLFILEICCIILNYQMNKFYKNLNAAIIKECLLLSNINFN